MSKAIVERATLIEDRPKAILIEQKGTRVWIPKSQIEYQRKDPPFAGGTPITIHIPEWLADEKGLDYY